VKPTRRSIIKTAALAFTAPAWSALIPARAARAQDRVWRHGLSLFGELKYPAGFPHFEYVNPKAPKGGAVRLTGLGGYDNFNPVIQSMKGNIAGGIGLLFDRLLTSSSDEIATAYGLVAESVSYPADYSSVTYRLRREAKWHDGAPITAEDVIFSFAVFKANDPRMAAYYRHVVKLEKSGEHEVTFTFDAPGNRELPQIVGEFEILPKHWWAATDKSGKQRNVADTTLEPPLGSGPYRIKDFAAGRFVVYERVKDYWAKDLNVTVGTSNFDELRYDYFRDSYVALEAFKAGQLDWRTENVAKNWATQYDFPAVKEKRVLREEFPIRSIGVMQAFAFNTRRDKFKDARVRRAFNFAFDFEEMNRQIFFSQYRRIASYFEGTELAWNWQPDPEDKGSGGAIPGTPTPEGLELEILQTVKDKVPPEVFTTPYTNPVGGGMQNMRGNLRTALQLMQEAGYEVRDTRLVNVKTGEPFAVEFLTSAEEPNLERFVLFYKATYLDRLGIESRVRPVDSAQYENRLRKWDYDIIVANWSETLSPGNEQRDRWTSESADRVGSGNYCGIKNPAIDTLVDRLIFAKDRAELVAVTRALDRVLMWNHYVVPNWLYGKQRTARWDFFAHPEIMPRYAAAAFPFIWWSDPDRAAKARSQ
jgi:microcin C transport system substrate-binding protein